MPILAMNKLGQIYVTGSDRSDGLGFSAMPEMVREGDLTLGSAYKKSQSKRRDSLLKSRRDQAVIDANDRAVAKSQRQILARKHAEEMNEANLLANENVRKSLLKEALSMGCSCEYNRPYTGNVMSANGMNGFAGQSPTQQAIAKHFTGRGAPSQLGIMPEEVSQNVDRARADQFFRSKASQQERSHRLQKSQGQVSQLGRMIHRPSASPFRVIAGRK